MKYFYLDIKPRHVKAAGYVCNNCPVAQAAAEQCEAAYAVLAGTDCLFLDDGRGTTVARYSLNLQRQVRRYDYKTSKFKPGRYRLTVTPKETP